MGVVRGEELTAKKVITFQREKAVVFFSRKK